MVRILIALGLLLLAPAVLGAQEKKALPVKKTIAAGLDYLVQEQAVDGSWGTKAFAGSPAITGLAGRALLAAGARPGEGARGKAVARAVEYLQQAGAEAGYFGGGNAGGHGPMYQHAFAVVFLAEVHAVADKDLAAKLKPVLTRAVKLIVQSQNDEGGWRYQPVPRDADISVTCCQLHALAAARAAGINVPRETVDKAAKYIRTCQQIGDGGFRYQPQGGPSGFARTAAACSALQHVGFKDDKNAIVKGIAFLLLSKPAPASPLHYYYGHYYAIHAMRSATAKDRATWYPAVRAELLARQQADGSWSDMMSPHYGTAMALLILQAPLPDGK